MNTTEPTFPPCPRCEGEHLYSLSWRHRTACPLYGLDSATAAADHERGRGVRELSATEAELVAEEYVPPPDSWALGVRFDHRGGIHHREIVERLNGPRTTIRPATRATTTTEESA